MNDRVGFLVMAAAAGVLSIAGPQPLAPAIKTITGQSIEAASAEVFSIGYIAALICLAIYCKGRWG